MISVSIHVVGNRLLAVKFVTMATKDFMTASQVVSGQNGKLKKLTIVVVVVPKAIIIDRNYTPAQKRYLACSVSLPRASAVYWLKSKISIGEHDEV